MFLQRFGGRQARPGSHCAFCPIGVAAPQLRQATDVADGIVDHFVLHRRTLSRFGFGVAVFLATIGTRRGPTQFPTTNRDWRCRPQVGCRRHRRNVAGIENVGSGTGGACARGCDVAHYRDG